MADVFLAMLAGPLGSGFRKLTVIKRLRAALADDPEFVQMLVDEARIAARLNHPNVVQTNEVGHIGREYFIAMEYLDGQPLHRVLHRAAAAGTPLGREMGLVILCDALSGLHHAHELADYDGTPLGIVHRDVTPHNIFVTYEGQVKVVDFGIAKAHGRSSETQHGVVKGKIRYMAPEQALGREVDRRADVFAAGVMLWEFLVSQRMWAGFEDVQIAHALAAGEVRRSPRAVNPEVPEALDRICQKALAPNRDERYATAEDLRRDLERELGASGKLVQSRRELGPFVASLFADKREELRRVVDETSGDETGVTDVAPEGPTSTMPVAVAKPMEPRRTPWIAAAAVALGLFGIGGAAWRMQHREHAQATAPVDVPTTKAEQVHLQIRAPHDAVIEIDGHAVANPYDEWLAKDEGQHTLRVVLDGRTIARKETSFSESRVWDFNVTEIARPVADESGSRKAPPGTNGRPASTEPRMVVSPSPDAGASSTHDGPSSTHEGEGPTVAADSRVNPGDSLFHAHLGKTPPGNKGPIQFEPNPYADAGR